MWIDRFEQGLSDRLSRVRHPQRWLGGAAAVIVVQLFAFGAIVNAQVERQNEREASVIALRAQLDRCHDERSAFAVDRCRQTVLAAHLPAPVPRLPQWPDATSPDAGAVAAVSVPVAMPVSLVSQPASLLR